MKIYGLLGFPLTHSFSQKYFEQKFNKEGISDSVYRLFPIDAIYKLNEILKDNPDLCGLNVTIPYKQAVLEHLTSFKNIPRGLHACNCIKVKAGKTFGYNTDIIGFEKSLLPHLNQSHKKALILGNGGAAEAVKFVLTKIDMPYTVVSRRLHSNAPLTYKHLDEATMWEHQLIVNTTPLGTFPNIQEYPDIPYQFLGSEHFLYDLVYNPETSLFLEKGAQMGTAIKNGYEMLVLQAEESWRIWNED
jgi:shikimate dehydrogenase